MPHFVNEVNSITQNWSKNKSVVFKSGGAVIQNKQFCYMCSSLNHKTFGCTGFYSQDTVTKPVLIMSVLGAEQTSQLVS